MEQFLSRRLGSIVHVKCFLNLMDIKYTQIVEAPNIRKLKVFKKNY